MIQVGVDIGGSHVTACLYDGKEQKLIMDSNTTYHVDPHWNAEKVLGTWSAAIIKTISYTDRSVQGVGIAVPGPFNYYEGVSLIRGVNKYESIYGVNVKNEISDRLGIDKSQVRFINDASAFAIAVSKVGKAKRFNRCVAVTLGTGLGAAFVANSMPVVEDVNVPQNGYLYNQYMDGVLADELFSTRGLVQLYRSLSGRKANNAFEIFQLIQTDPWARETFSLFGKKLGRFLNPYLEKFGAEALVFGGNISHAFDAFKKPLLEELTIDEVHPSCLMDNAALIGGALLLDDAYYEDLSTIIRTMQ